MEISACIAFPDSGKEIVSGIDFMNRLSTMIFQVAGNAARLAQVDLRFPFPLQKDEWAEVILKQDAIRRIKTSALKRFSVQATGLRSQKVVLIGTFLVVAE